jgi:hypothetical protein
MDTFLAKLPANWSAYYSKTGVKQYIYLYGEELALVKLVNLIQLHDAVEAQKPALEAAKKKLLSSTIFYNRRAEAPPPKRVAKKKSAIVDW